MMITLQQIHPQLWTLEHIAYNIEPWGGALTLKI